MPYKYYSGSNIPEVIEIAQSTYSFSGGTALPNPNYDLLSSLDNSRIWLLLRKADRGFYDRVGQLLEITNALDNKFKKDMEYDFPGVEVVLYKLDSLEEK